MSSINAAIVNGEVLIIVFNDSQRFNVDVNEIRLKFDNATTSLIENNSYDDTLVRSIMMNIVNASETQSNPNPRRG